MTRSLPKVPTIPAADEIPLETRPDLPNWSENYCMQAYDPAAETGVWLHCGLPIYDFDLWHDITIVYLPGGEEVLLAKGFGPRRSGHDVPGPMLTGDYDEQSGDWVWRFHGAAVRANRRDLAAGPLNDGPVEPVRFELRFSGLSPVWDLKRDVVGQVWTNAHWEQPCGVTGWVEYAGTRYPFDGSGIRDHSRGSRHFLYMGPHYWLHGQFPSGRAFGLLHVEPTSGQPKLLSKAYLVVDGQLEDVTVTALPADRTLPGAFDVILEGPRGTEHIRGELVHDMSITVEYPNELLFGYRPGKQQHLLREGQTRWTWDGEVGYGLGERTDTLDAAGNLEDR